MHRDPSRIALSAARRAARSADRPLLLAVSGGLDSMVLLSTMVAVARSRIAGVATFDHGTGAAAADAVCFVCDAGARARLPVIQGKIPDGAIMRGGREAGWRAERYRFLHETASSLGAHVVTAHTEDDQLETLLMRIMRGSGARGLAGLYAAGPVQRPFVAVRRADLHTYAMAAGITWIDDPTNSSTDFARNRIRRDVLPALRRAAPSIDAELLALARRADALRREVDGFVSGTLRPQVREGQELIVASRELTGYDRGSLAILWAALAGRVGLALDRRGTARLAAFTTCGRRSGSIPLAGGWCLEAGRDAYVLSRAVAAAPLLAAELPVRGSMEWGRFRFRTSAAPIAASLWSASIPGSATGTVRSWRAGDRLEPAGGQPRRRVTRYLSDMCVRGTDRADWPVIVAGDQVVWIPGVRRSDAATDRSGRPVRHYVCERIDR